MTQQQEQEAELKWPDLSNLDPEVKEVLIQDRIEAEELIDRLDPAHISSWADLIRILEESLREAKKIKENEEFVLRGKIWSILEEQDEKYE